MQRTVLHIKPEQRKKLNSLAKKQHVSLAEINRRAIEQYLTLDLSSPEITLLENFLIDLEKSNKKTIKKLTEVEKNLNETLKMLKNCTEANNHEFDRQNTESSR